MQTSVTSRDNYYNHYSSFVGPVKFRARIVTSGREQREAEDKAPVTDSVPVTNSPDDGHQYMEVSIPAEDMIDLVMQHLISEKIGKLEQLTGEEALKLLLEGRF